MSINKVRTVLYGTAKILGDIQAVRKGPAAIGKRILRRGAGKVTGRGLGKLFK